MGISKQHQEFINNIANGLTQKEAYKVSVGKKGVSSQVAEVKGSQLAKKYADLIHQERERLKKVVEAAQDNKIAEIAEMKIMSAAKRMELLSMMANGELRIKQPIVIAGKIMEYPAEPTAVDRRAAIAELNKMEGSYAAIKQDITIKKSGLDKAEETYE